MSNVIRCVKEEKKQDREWWLSEDEDGIQLMCSDGSGGSWYIATIMDDGTLRINGCVKDDCASPSLKRGRSRKIEIRK